MLWELWLETRVWAAKVWVPRGVKSIYPLSLSCATVWNRTVTSGISWGQCGSLWCGGHKGADGLPQAQGTTWVLCMWSACLLSAPHSGLSWGRSKQSPALWSQPQVIYLQEGKEKNHWTVKAQGSPLGHLPAKFPMNVPALACPNNVKEVRGTG